jgi:uncharacterized protein (TIGR02231 family)
MKKCILMVIIVFFIPSVLVAANEIIVSPNLSGAKVFLKGAELTHTARMNLEKGLNKVVFTGLASKIEGGGISVSGKGDAVIMSVVQRFDYMRPVEKNPQIKALEDSLDALNKSLSLNQIGIDALKTEIDLLAANKRISGKGKGLFLTDLQKMAEYYTKRHSEINSRILDLSLNGKKIQKDIDRVKNQLNELAARIKKTTNEVVISVLSKAGGVAELNLAYFIPDAGWQPSYDIRVDRINSPVILTSKAEVRQQSGIDWKDVEVVLSTRNPSLSNEKPEISTWFIDFQRRVYSPRMKAIEEKSSAARMHDDYALRETQEALPEAATMADYFDVNTKLLSVEFKPQIKYPIPSDGKPHYVALQEFSIPAVFEYYAAPRIDGNAFLVANLTDWAGYNLLAGQSNIYFENTYIGQAHINPESAKDKLSISLGRDQNLSVSRESLKDFSEDKLLSGDLERTFAFEIKVKNNKKVAVIILIEEQVPVSKNKDITVKLVESSGAEFNPENGRLKWLVDVEAGKSVSKKLVYSIRHPKDKKIEGL